MLWIIKQKRNEIKLIGSCPCLKKRFFGIKMLRYCTFFFDIEHISSRIKLKNKINKNFLRINNKGIFAFLWIQKRKRNEIHFFSKGQKKTRNVRSQKKRNVDIPTPLPSARRFFNGAWQCYFEMKTNKELYFSILSSIILWYTLTTLAFIW